MASTGGGATFRERTKGEYAGEYAGEDARDTTQLWDEEVYDVEDSTDLTTSNGETTTTRDSHHVPYSESSPVASNDDPWGLCREMTCSLVSTYDSATINPRTSCFFLIDSEWVEIWKAFISGSRMSPPGPITNLRLYKGDSVTIRDDIQPVRDYRGVNPTVWYIYVALYDTDGSAPICRYTVDHRGKVVGGEKFEEYTKGAKMKALMETRKMKLRLAQLNEEGGIKKATLPPRYQEFWLWCIPRDFVERLFECIVGCTCCRNVGVRYKKLAKDNDDDDADTWAFEEEEDDDDNESENVADEDNIQLRRNFPNADLMRVASGST